MELPKKIEECPIVDAVLEIRFSSKIYSSAVFGLIYRDLEKKYPSVEKLPILQLPEELREKDPNLLFKPTYKAIGEEFTIQIGPRVFSISSNMPYKGWEKFSNEIEVSIRNILRLNIIENVSRLGLRYINYFDGNIFKNIHLEVKINSELRELKNTVLRTELRNENFINTLQIANNAKNIHGGQEGVGSIIDIDTFKEFEDDTFMHKYMELINEAHKVEKALFFSLFRVDYLESLKPVYS